MTTPQGEDTGGLWQQIRDSRVKYLAATLCLIALVVIVYPEHRILWQWSTSGAQLLVPDPSPSPTSSPLPPRCPVAPDDKNVSTFAYVMTPHDTQYFVGAIVVAHTLKQTRTTADIVIIYIKNTVCQALLNEAIAMGFTLKETEPPPHVHTQADYAESTLKISGPWGLTEYDKVIYLDVDNIVDQNIDDLFYCPSLAAVNHWDQLNRKTDMACTSCSASCQPNRKWLMSAMMVIKPDPSKIQPILSCTHPDINFVSDMDYINCYFQCQFTALPKRYQLIDSDYEEYVPAAWKQPGDSAVVHWSCGKKPFMRQFFENLIAGSPTKHPRCRMDELWHKKFYETNVSRILGQC